MINLFMLVSTIILFSILWNLQCASSQSSLSSSRRKIHHIQWSSNVSATYPPSDPLRVKLGDFLNITCPANGTSNVWIQHHLEQYKECNCSAAASTIAENSNECDPTFPLQVVCQDEVFLAIIKKPEYLNNVLGFQQNTTFYLISYSRGNKNFAGYESWASGGQCTQGFKMAVTVLPNSDQLACESLDNLISNSINTRELECVRKSDCSGLQCFSQNSFLKNFVELFDLTFLPCMKPTPVLWLQLLGREDPTNNNRRNVVLSRNVTESGNVSFSVRSGGGDIVFGVYRFIANFSEDYSTVAVSVQLIISGITAAVIDYTEIWFDASKCPIESTTAPPTTTDTPTAPPLITTTAVPPTSGPVLTPPEIEPHCTHINWRNSPSVSCGDISGYDVRLFNPDTNETVERRVDTRGTFHNFLESDKDLLEKKSTAVQVRVVSSTNIGPYSSPKEVGCYKPQPSTVYFELNKERYENNSMVSILNIGEGDDALLCKTDKQDCCGTHPNRFGEFYYPHGVRVPINSARQDFYRDRGEQLIRLNRREGISSPTGRYRCEIPDANGINQKIFINITQ